MFGVVEVGVAGTRDLRGLGVFLVQLELVLAVDSLEIVIKVSKCMGQGGGEPSKKR